MKKYLENLKYNVKQACIFHFNFAWCSVQVDIIHEEQEGGFFLLNRENPLRVLKVICRWSLTIYLQKTLVNRWIFYDCNDCYDFADLSQHSQIYLVIFACKFLIHFIPNVRKRLLRDINWTQKQIEISECYLSDYKHHEHS